MAGDARFAAGCTNCRCTTSSSGAIRVAAPQLLGIGKTTAYRKVKQYGLATGIGAGYCPNCGRRLPRHAPTTAERVPPPSTATLQPLVVNQQGYSPLGFSRLPASPHAHFQQPSRPVARLHKDAMVRDNGRVRKCCKVRNK